MYSSFVSALSWTGHGGSRASLKKAGPKVDEFILDIESTQALLTLLGNSTWAVHLVFRSLRQKTVNPEGKKHGHEENIDMFRARD